MAVLGGASPRQHQAIEHRLQQRAAAPVVFSEPTSSWSNSATTGMSSPASRAAVSAVTPAHAEQRLSSRSTRSARPLGRGAPAA